MASRRRLILAAAALAVTSMMTSAVQAQSTLLVDVVRSPRVVVCGNAQNAAGNAIECGAAFTKCQVSFPPNTTVVLTA